MNERRHPPPRVIAGRRILVVEDEMLLAIEVVDELEGVGAIPVGPIPTVAEALTIIEQSSIDAAMLNVQLRGELSFPIAAALAARNIPFVFVTANEDLVREHFPDVMAHPKPYELAALVDCLETVIGR